MGCWEPRGVVRAARLTGEDTCDTAFDIPATCGELHCACAWRPVKRGFLRQLSPSLPPVTLERTDMQASSITELCTRCDATRCDIGV